MKSKIFLTIVILLLILNTPIYSQKIRIGLNAGVSLCNQKFTNPFYEKYSVILGDVAFFPTFGVYGQYSFTKKFGLLVDLNFQRKGLTYRETFQLQGLSGKFEKKENYIDNFLNYFQIDVLPKYYLGKRKFKLHVSGGPYMAVLLSAISYGSYSYAFNETPIVGNGTLTTEYEGFKSVVGREDGIKGLFKKTDYGVQAGLGFEVGRFGVGYRFVYGLRNIYLDEAFYKATNYSHTLKVSFAFLHLMKDKQKVEIN